MILIFLFSRYKDKLITFTETRNTCLGSNIYVSLRQAHYSYSIYICFQHSFVFKKKVNLEFCRVDL